MIGIGSVDISHVDLGCVEITWQGGAQSNIIYADDGEEQTIRRPEYTRKRMVFTDLQLMVRGLDVTV